MINKEFGSITVIRYAEPSVYLLNCRAKCWVCQCKCGQKLILTSTDLRCKNATLLHCGCKSKNHVNIIGLKFGMLTPLLKTINNVSSPMPPKEGERIKKVDRSVTYFCQCDCGRTCNYKYKSLQNKKMPACSICV